LALQRAAGHSDTVNRILISLYRIDGRSGRRTQMTKLFAFAAALVVLAPFAFATMSQAAQMMA
jgi:hypothetical protein